MVLVFTEILWLGILGGILGFATLMTFFSEAVPKDLQQNLQRRYDDEYRKRWLKRVRIRLYQQGVASTADFAGLPVELDEINWAIRLYFQIYEFEKNLIYDQKYLENPDKYLAKYKICEIRFMNVASQLDQYG